MSESDEDIARLRASVDDLESRVARLEAQQTPSPVLVPNTDHGLKLINRIGALTVAIGVIFFFKYAVDEQIIGASAGVFLGVVFGALLVGAGEWLIKRGQRVFAQGVSGCGLATIYISIYASFAFYKILIESAGFAFLTLISALAVALSIRYKYPAIAALGFIGALLTPILLHNREIDAALAFPFLLFVQVTALFITLRQNWPPLAAIVAPLSVLSAAVLFEPKHSAWLVWFALALSGTHFAASLYTKTPGTTKTTLYVLGHSLLLVAGLRILDLSLSQHSAVRELASVFLAIYGIALLAYGLLRKSTVNQIFGLVLTGIVIAKLYLFDVWVLARVYRITAFLGLGALLLVASYIYSRSDKRNQ